MQKTGRPIFNRDTPLPSRFLVIRRSGNLIGAAQMAPGNYQSSALFLPKFLSPCLPRLPCASDLLYERMMKEETSCLAIFLFGVIFLGLFSSGCNADPAFRRLRDVLTNSRDLLLSLQSRSVNPPILDFMNSLPKEIKPREGKGDKRGKGEG